MFYEKIYDSSRSGKSSSSESSSSESAPPEPPGDARHHIYEDEIEEIVTSVSMSVYKGNRIEAK